MKLYAALPLAGLLLASVALREPPLSETTPAQREGLAEQVETILRKAGYPIADATPANTVSALPQRAFRTPGCASDAIAVALHFREIALLRAAWARFAITLPEYRLSLHYGDGQWTEINRPAMILEQVRLQFSSYTSMPPLAGQTAILVASPAPCDAPAVNWSALWQLRSAQVYKADTP